MMLQPTGQLGHTIALLRPCTTHALVAPRLSIVPPTKGREGGTAAPTQTWCPVLANPRRRRHLLRHATGRTGQDLGHVHGQDSHRFGCPNKPRQPSSPPTAQWLRRHTSHDSAMSQSRSLLSTGVQPDVRPRTSTADRDDDAPSRGPGCDIMCQLIVYGDPKPRSPHRLGTCCNGKCNLDDILQTGCRYPLRGQRIGTRGQASSLAMPDNMVTRCGNILI